MASARIYSEIIGDTKTADAYYQKVDSKVKENIDQFFE